MIWEAEPHRAHLSRLGVVDKGVIGVNQGKTLLMRQADEREAVAIMAHLRFVRIARE